MKFLITGAYGFVGTNLCRYLVERGHACDALDIPTAKREDVPYSHVFTWEELGSGNENAGSPKLRTFEYDCIVHLAGKAHDLKKVASEQSYFDVNVGLTRRIFDTLCASREMGSDGRGRERRVSFVYFSSCKSVERDTPYAKSKWAAEEYLTSAVRLLPSSSPLRVTILRPAPIHGPGNKGNLNLLWSVVKHGIPWPLAAFENKRPFTSVGNVCAAVEALAASVAGRPNLQTYFICDDDFLSTNRIIELMAQARGSHARLWKIPKALMKGVARIGDVLHLPLNTERIEKLTEDYFVDNSALKAALGWDRFPVLVEDGMLETFKSFL